MEPNEHYTTSQRLPMTVVAALDCGDHLLIGSDSQVYQEHYKFWAVKLHNTDVIPLAWGYAGDYSIGEDLDRWLMRYSWGEITSWEQFRADVAQELTRLNGEKRRLKRLARVKIELGDTTSVLFAGFINGEAELLEIDDRGNYSFNKGRTFAAIGSGMLHAKVARRAMEAFEGKQFSHNEQTLRFMLQMAIVTDPYCNWPEQAKRITSVEVVDLWKNENQIDPNP